MSLLDWIHGGPLELDFMPRQRAHHPTRCAANVGSHDGADCTASTPPSELTVRPADNSP
jgi:hypothetical protein